MSRIIDEALALIHDQIPNLSEIRTSEVRFGLIFTGVKLDTGHVGMCHSLLGEVALPGCHVMSRAGTLAGSPATEIANLARSWDLGESAVGVAALNALSQVVLEEEKYLITEGNFMDHIKKRLRKSDVVALVGNIKPFVKILAREARELHVFERGLKMQADHTLPDTAFEEYIPRSDIVIATGSSLVNKSLDRVLKLSKCAREIGVVGPSAGLIPDPLFRRGVTIVGGVKVISTDRLFQIISEGGGTPQIKQAVKFINIRPRS